ncbi:MAG: type I 3-dehydroquinate dehydratase [Chthoniobacterales bacterium]
MLSIKHINLVGTIHSEGGLAAARKQGAILNAAEFRADMLPHLADSTALRKLSTPIIWTVRCATEGGRETGSLNHRVALYEAGFDVARLVDVELSSVKKLKSTLLAAKSQRCKLIYSFHDFQSTPPISNLRRIARRAEDGGADIVKIATVVDSLESLSRLMEVFNFSLKVPLAVMGMGRFGKVSRLLCAQAGSVLNYGWLDRPQVTGQWSAAELAARFEDLNIKRPKVR